jgi:Flp pilus assembly protein TadD
MKKPAAPTITSNFTSSNDSRMKQALQAFQGGQYELALQLCDGSEAMQMLEGDALRMLGRYGEAETVFKEILKRKEDHEVYARLGWVFMEIGREEEAIAAYRSTLQIAPLYPQVNLNLGVLL